MRSSSATLQSRAAPDYAVAFASALLDPTRGVPDGVEGPRHGVATKRFNVYRNNVTVSLIEALASIYPAVRRITGPDFFRAMARSHVRVSPPSSPLLFDYGRDFPNFIEGYAYARSTPWLADVARVERAWLDCCHAADASPLNVAALGAVAPENSAISSSGRIRRSASFAPAMPPPQSSPPGATKPLRPLWSPAAPRTC